ncbi:DUF3368 domain-containing protein [uncultured Thiodictyon sp.]|uniref:DUF3368 domain-containing protein n=1 Tax=uncultured Thiodictyon sp. TaxID=1846217 RepID=UPI0025F476B3|nr:DUF3368 domain-containing protein [uncultured Thiodictyon sp.]
MPDRMIVNASPLIFFGIVLAAKRMGWIAAARPLVERLLGDGLYLSRTLVVAALAEVGE